MLRPYLGKGCIVCKVRKVKCDGNNSRDCSRCQKLGLQCPGPQPAGASTQADAESLVDSLYRDAGHTKRRYKASCLQCRLAKTRCSQTRPGCVRCQKKKIDCVYDRAQASEADASCLTSAPPRSEGQESASPGLPTAPNTPSALYTALASETAANDVPAGDDLPEVEESPSQQEQDPCAWLCSPDIPSGRDKLSLLVDQFFSHIHGIHLLSFLHPPSVRKALDSGHMIAHYGPALVCVICALGARFVERDKAGNARMGEPGHAWALKAQALVFQDPGRVSAYGLMAMALLWEYQSRFGSHSAAVMIAASCSRAVQLLRLDVEDTNDTTPAMASPEVITSRESRRRLFWACWLIDITVGAGLDRFLTLSRNIPTVYLPCAEQDFIYQVPSRPRRLIPEPPYESQPSEALYPPRLQVYQIRLAHLRSLTLRCIRDANPSPLPWEPGSAFRKVVQHLEQLVQDLPPHLQLTDQNMYIHRDQHRLANFVSLHAGLHVCFIDLFRTMLPGYDFPLAASLAFAPAEFVSTYRRECLLHAQAISGVIELGLKHGRFSFDDTMCLACAYESARAQMILARLPESQSQDFDSKSLAHNVNVNVQVLARGVAKPGHRRRCLVSLVEEMHRAGLHDLAAEWAESMSAERTGQAGKEASREHTNPLAYVREAWNEIASSGTTGENSTAVASVQVAPPANIGMSGGDSPAGDSSNSVELPGVDFGLGGVLNDRTGGSSLLLGASAAEEPEPWADALAPWLSNPWDWAPNCPDDLIIF